MLMTTAMTAHLALQAERTAKLQQVLAMEAELKDTEAKLAQYADNDPLRFEEMSA